ncbi:MAG: acetyl-CoA hydrolase/transferase family protein [Dehalococcoidia bacterium]
MDWRERFADRLVSLEDAVGAVRSGDTVLAGIPEPVPFLLALAGRTDIEDVTVMSAVAAQGMAALAAHPGVRALTGFANEYSRPFIDDGRVEFIPVTFFGASDYVARLAARVTVVVVAEPEPDGTVAPGMAIAYDDAAVRTAQERGDLVYGMVVESQPRIGGEGYRVEDFDGLIPLPTTEGAVNVEERPASEHAGAVAVRLGELVPDGATMQAGVGGLPDETVSLLVGHKDLGVHTEVLGLGLAGLVEQGVATGAKKVLHRGKAVCTIALPGAVTEDHDRRFAVLGAASCLDPRLIAQNPKLRCVNSAMQIDLGGQTNAEMLNGSQFSGVGGQLDFFRACQLTSDSLSILALESTAAGGTVSRIVPWIPEGNVVTSSRYDIDVVITEHGVAWLRDRSTRERAEGLISIADPDHRSFLEESAGRLGLLRR